MNDPALKVAKCAAEYISTMLAYDDIRDVERLLPLGLMNAEEALLLALLDQVEPDHRYRDSLDAEGLAFSTYRQLRMGNAAARVVATKQAYAELDRRTDENPPDIHDYQAAWEEGALYWAEGRTPYRFTIAKLAAEYLARAIAVDETESLWAQITGDKVEYGSRRDALDLAFTVAEQSLLQVFLDLEEAILQSPTEEHLRYLGQMGIRISSRRVTVQVQDSALGKDVRRRTMGEIGQIGPIPPRIAS